MRDLKNKDLTPRMTPRMARVMPCEGVSTPLAAWSGWIAAVHRSRNTSIEDLLHLAKVTKRQEWSLCSNPNLRHLLFTYRTSCAKLRFDFTERRNDATQDFITNGEGVILRRATCRY